jgi:hypothetical protein
MFHRGGKKMKSNKMGIHVRKSVGSFLDTVFGRTAGFGHAESKFHNGINLIENVNLDNQIRRTLLEAEFKEWQGFELIRKLQNC